jgi:hypothetical protein
LLTKQVAMRRLQYHVVFVAVPATKRPAGHWA